MSKVHVIAMDTHSQTTDICVKTRPNSRGRAWRVPTTIPEILAVIEQVRMPRELVIEEGPMAGWLLRNLRGHVSRAMACDPRKNALIARDGDKDDPIDAGKLCDLYLGGYVNPVHHPQTLEREVARQTVGLYHERVAHRVRQANKLIGLFKRWGVMVKEKDFVSRQAREQVLLKLKDAAGSGELQGAAWHVELLLGGYDEAVRQEELLRQEVQRLGRSQEVVVRWQAVPGIGWIRGMTLLAYLDTPWRFKSKRKLWKYMGIGVVRERSGEGFARVHVEAGANRRLKNAIIGAADTVILQQRGELFGRYESWREQGLSFRNARRNVARDIASICWALWKTGGTYDPRLIGGRPATDQTEGGGL